MDGDLAFAQALRYAEELRSVYVEERSHRRVAEDALERLAESYRLTVGALAAALELRDGQTADHAERVTSLALRLTRLVAPELLDDPQLEYGFLLHDLGKIGVPDAILLKPGRLDDGEMEIMRRHATFGSYVVAAIPYLDGLARDVIAAHHERWDGDGYPARLRGEEIPQVARIFAVVDAFDAMTSDRPYRRGMPADVAMERLREGAGSQFDPAIVDAFGLLADELELTSPQHAATARRNGDGNGNGNELAEARAEASRARSHAAQRSS